MTSKRKKRMREQAKDILSELAAARFPTPGTSPAPLTEGTELTPAQGDDSTTPIASPRPEGGTPAQAAAPGDARRISAPPKTAPFQDTAKVNTGVHSKPVNPPPALAEGLLEVPPEGLPSVTTTDSADAVVTDMEESPPPDPVQGNDPARPPSQTHNQPQEQADTNPLDQEEGRPGGDDDGEDDWVSRSYYLFEKHTDILDRLRRKGLKKFEVIIAAVDSMHFELANGTWEEPINSEPDIPTMTHNPALQAMLVKRVVAEQTPEAVKRTHLLPLRTVRLLETCAQKRKQLLGEPPEEGGRTEVSSTLRAAIERLDISIRQIEKRNPI